MSLSEYKEELISPKIVIDTDLPDVICIEPIHTCNLRCIMCHVSYQDLTKKKLNIDDVLIQLKDVKPGTVIVIGWSYEPVAHPQFVKLVKGLSALGCQIDLTSNGTLFTDKLIEQIKDVNFRFVAISFDGIRKGTFEFIRRRAVYERTVKRILNFRNAFKDKPVQFQINYVVMKENLDEMIEAVDFWDQHEFDIIYFFLTRFRADDPLVLEQSLETRMDQVYARFEELALDSLEKKRRLRVKAQAFSFGPLRKKFGDGKVFAAGTSPILYKHGFRLANQPMEGLPVSCTAAYTMVSLWFDGRVSLCNELEIGNINKDGTILEIFQSYAARNVRNGLQQNPKNCTSCEFFKSCVRNINEDGEEQDIHNRGGREQDQVPNLKEQDKHTYYVKWKSDFYSIPKVHKSIPKSYSFRERVRYCDHKVSNIKKSRVLESLKRQRQELSLQNILKDEYGDVPYFLDASDKYFSLIEKTIAQVIEKTANKKSTPKILVVGNVANIENHVLRHEISKYFSSFPLVDFIPLHEISKEDELILEHNTKISQAKLDHNGEKFRNIGMEQLENCFYDVIILSGGVEKVKDFSLALKPGGHLCSIPDMLWDVEPAVFEFGKTSLLTRSSWFKMPTEYLVTPALFKSKNIGRRIDKAQIEGKGIFIFGASDFGLKNFEWFSQLKRTEIKGFVDSYKAGSFSNLPIVTPDQLNVLMNTGDLVVVASSAWAEIHKTLEQLNIANILISWSTDHPYIAPLLKIK